MEGSDVTGRIQVQGGNYSRGQVADIKCGAGRPIFPHPKTAKANTSVSHSLDSRKNRVIEILQKPREGKREVVREEPRKGSKTLKRKRIRKGNSNSKRWICRNLVQYGECSSVYDFS
ncbi:hypothetical protein NE237_025231 [Protea cynaroides]|uniref:Uncharacterized protein n=1 Tax=Protea cynaroides TaxID=273540 RepID=A0A9Q0H4V2_9MAGN|nr:hypothetical protein NE237_025231 [Protea cynaroides]